MKYKILLIVLGIVIILAAIIMPNSNNGLLDRTHQHLEYDEKIKSDENNDEFCTHLPIIRIHLEEEEPKVYEVEYENGITEMISEDVQADVEVFDNASSYNYLSDEPALHTDSKVRIRGNSSMRFDKKNYKMSFINPDGSENKEFGLLGMEPHDEWVLHGPYLDRALIRNYMCMNIAGQILPYTPDVRFCELFIDEEYMGVYVAMETVARGEGRVDIKRYADGDEISSYIVLSDWDVNPEKVIEPFTAYTKMIDSKTNMRIVYPGERLTPEIKDYISADISRYEKALYSFDYDSEVHGYKSFYDMDTFIDYIVINEFFQNYDAGYLSTFFYKDIGDQLHIGPVWDYNSAMDNFYRTQTDLSVIHAVRYKMLMRDEDFVEAVINRYYELRKSILSEEYLINYIDETVEFLGPAIDRNYEVWGDVFDYELMQKEIVVQDEWRNPEDYQMSIDDMKDYISKRGSWLDEHIGVLRQYSHESMVKKYNH